MFKQTFFSLNKDSRIIIYGAGGLGRKMASRLNHAGYQVIAFIDRNAEEMDFVSGIPVYSLINIEKNTDEVQKKCVVIICLHNALWHPQVAETLYAIGYENIIFLPLGDQFHYIPRTVMEEAYGYLEDEIYEALKELPTYSTLTKFTISSEDGVISRTDTAAIVWMELTSIFTNGVLKQRGNAITQIYGDVSICALKPYTELFHFCKFGVGDIDLYCKAFKEVQNAKDIYSFYEFVQDRIELYEKLRLELNRGMDYFIRSAPTLSWDSKLKRFNVVEGHHRLIFLLQEGLSFVPVKISNRDFEIWKNESIYQQCCALLKKYQIKSWFTPLNHPGFYYFPSEREHINPSILIALQKEIGTYAFDKCTVLDCFGIGGYFSRSLKIMGCGKAICYEENTVYASVIRMLDKLFYQNVTVVEKAWQEDVDNLPVSDIAFFSFPHTPSSEISTYVSKIKEKVRRYMILELPATESPKTILPHCSYCGAKLLKRDVSTKTFTNIWLLFMEKEIE